MQWKGCAGVVYFLTLLSAKLGETDFTRGPTPIGALEKKIQSINLNSIVWLEEIKIAGVLKNFETTL